MRQTARQCPFYISFIEKHSQIKIVEKWVDTAQRGSTIQIGDNRRFFHVACFTTHLQILPVNFRYLGNCGILSLGKGSFVWTSQLCCIEEGALSNTTVAILQLLSETAVFCISRIANFDFSQQVLKSSALWQSIVGWESSRKSSGCLPEPRGSRCPSFSNSLSLSLSLSLDFSSIWEKYAKAHHSLNSHLSPSYIQPQVRGEENWTNWEQQIYPKFSYVRHCLLNTIIQMNMYFYFKTWGRVTTAQSGSGWMNYWRRGRHRRA